MDGGEKEMRVTLKNGVVLEFDSTGMVEDFRECGRMVRESGGEDCNSEEIKSLLREYCQKEIPQKPTFDGDGYAPDGTAVWDEWICPCCGSRDEVDYDEYDYCPNCGQRIDWAEANESEL